MLEAMEDKILAEDIENISNDKLIDFERFRDKSIFITGATGLIGSQIVKTLSYVNRKMKLNMRLILLIRDYDKTKSIFGDLLKEEYFTIISGDILSDINIEEKVDYVIHGASPTSSKYFVEHPVETIKVTVDGTKNVLELAKRKEIQGLVYLSSLEVYGNPEGKTNISENDYGYIDNLNIRSSYSEGKRMAECLSISYYKEYGVPIKIARLSQTFGAGFDYKYNRVFAEFIRCVIQKKDIILHTEGKTIRTYCYTKDAIIAILFLLLYGEKGEAYNITNEETSVTIKELAELVCNIYADSGIKTIIDVPKDIEKFGYNPEMIIKLNTNKINKLGWKATVGIKDMIIRMKKSIDYRNF